MITTPPLPVWVKAVRLLGAGIGLLMICCSLAGGFPSIGAHIRWSYRHYVVCLHIFLGLLLMLRWSRIPLAPTLTFILVVFVICLVLLLPHYALAFTQTLGNANFSCAQKIVFSLLEVGLVLILFAQIPSLWVIRNRLS